MTREKFEQLVAEGIESIPARFLRLLNNVAVIIEDVPTLRQLGRTKAYSLLGLYEGIPHTQRQHYGVGATMPDRITIFRRPIETLAGGDSARIRDIVHDTVRHEIAHHFGMDEGRVRRSEAARRHR